MGPGQAPLGKIQSVSRPLSVSHFPVSVAPKTMSFFYTASRGAVRSNSVVSKRRGRKSRELLGMITLPGEEVEE